jgi:hypothetical protein
LELKATPTDLIGIGSGSDAAVRLAQRRPLTTSCRSMHAMKEGKVAGDPAKLADERTNVRDILRSMPPSRARRADLVRLPVFENHSLLSIPNSLLL